MKRKTRPGLYTTKLLVLTHACSVDAVDDFSRGDRTLQLLLQPAGHVLTPQLRLLLRPIPVPVRHGHQPPVGSAELPALEERPARRHAAQEVSRPVHLDGHVAPGHAHHRVEAVALRRHHLLAHPQPQVAERRGHLPLEYRGAHLARDEVGVVALGELTRQRWPLAIAAALEFQPELPLVQLAAALDGEALALG